MKFGPLLIGLSSIALLAGCNGGGGTDDTLRPVDKTKMKANDVAMAKEEMADKEGIPLYPGSEAPEGQSTIVPGTTESRYTLILTTADPVKKVVDFYKGKLPGVSIAPNKGTFDIMGKTPSGSLAHIIINSEDKKTKISASAIVESPAPKAP